MIGQRSLECGVPPTGWPWECQDLVLLKISFDPEKTYVLVD